MSYLRHIECCNRFDPACFVPLMLGRRRVGRIPREAVGALADCPAVLRVSGEAVTFNPSLADRQSRTEALAEITAGLIRQGLIGSTRNEAFAVTDEWSGTVLFELDRGAVPFFGTRSYGVHLNGYCRGGDGLALWIGKRAPDKKVAPGKLDNLVAGGISAGYDSWSTLLKEAAEEADLPQSLAATSRPAGAIRYRMATPEGSRDDVLFVYDIRLPADFRPRNTDGEIADFRLMPVEECLRLVRETDEFKFNVNLVLIDFAIRHGRIGPEDPDFLRVAFGLRGGSIED